MSDHVPLAAYALAAEVDRRNGDPLGTTQPLPLTAFVADLRDLVALERGEVCPHVFVRSHPSLTTW